MVKILRSDDSEHTTNYQWLGGDFATFGDGATVDMAASVRRFHGNQPTEGIRHCEGTAPDSLSDTCDAC